MRYSKGRIRKLSKEIIDSLKDKEAVTFLVKEESVRNVIIEVMDKYFDYEDEVYKIVSDSIAKRKKNVIPGSSEWEVMFRKLYEEEMGKRLMGGE